MDKERKPARLPNTLHNGGKHLIPRRKPSRPAQAKSPGDAATSTRADHKNHSQYITEEVGCQADKARGQAKPTAWPQPAARMTQADIESEAQV